MDVLEVLLVMGVPTAITGFLVWFLKRHIDKRESAREKREENVERVILMIMQTGRANNVLATATAAAVQRIPEAHCNGDIKKALEEAARIQKEEQKFLLEHGVQHIFHE